MTFFKTFVKKKKFCDKNFFVDSGQVGGGQAGGF